MEGKINLLRSGKTTVFAIDASSANKEKRTGVEQYAYQLIEAMKKEPLLDGERVFLYSPTPLTGALADLPKGWESSVLAWKLPRGWMQGRMSLELLRRRPNVLFVPAQGLPRIKFGTRILTTIHDVAFRRVPQLYDPSVRRRVAKTTRQSIKKADHLLSVSEFTKQEVIDLYKIPDEKITVAHLAADTAVFRRMETSTVEAILRRLRLGSKFFLFVGRMEQKKNVAMLIRAFELFKQNRGVGDPFELILVGETGFGYQQIKSLIDYSPAHEMIRQTGYLPDEDVSALMNTAEAFCFPSHAEGFGIPLVEAMACGCPLLVSDIAVHHEVAGDAAIYLNPQAPEVWAREMDALIDDSVRQDRLVEKGAIRAAQFSWQKTAKDTWEVLRSLV